MMYYPFYNFWIQYAYILFRIFESIFMKDFVFIFFSHNIFVWFWYQGNADLIKQDAKYPFLSYLL